MYSIFWMWPPARIPVENEGFFCWDSLLNLLNMQCHPGGHWNPGRGATPKVYLPTNLSPFNYPNIGPYIEWLRVWLWQLYILLMEKIRLTSWYGKYMVTIISFTGFHIRMSSINSTTKTSWGFQPIWKIWVELDQPPRRSMHEKTMVKELIDGLVEQVILLDSIASIDGSALCWGVKMDEARKKNSEKI